MNNTQVQPESFSAQMRHFFLRNLSWFLAVALALLLLQDVFGKHGLLAMHRSQQDAARVQKEIDDLSKENRQLENGVKDLKTDPAAIERIAREEMGLAKPGEYIFKLPPRTADKSNPPASSVPPSNPNSH